MMTDAEALSHFQYEHLPPDEQIVAHPFYDAASIALAILTPCNDRDQVLAHLLEARAFAMTAGLKVELCAK